LFDLKDYNGKHFVKVSQQKLERRPCLPVVAKAMSYWVGRPTAADVATPAQLITLTLLTNCCHTKMARRKIIADCT